MAEFEESEPTVMELEDEVSSKEIVLHPAQMIRAARIMQIISHQRGYFDFSGPGSGKRMTSLWIAQQISIPILAICPKWEDAENWKQLTHTYGVQVVDIVSYASLVNTDRYLTPHPNVDGTVRFQPTPLFSSILQSGAMIVFGGFERGVKVYPNLCRAILELVSQNGMSRFALLTPTPFDSNRGMINFLRVIGFMQSPLFKNSNGIQWMGMLEIITTCRLLNEAKTNEILESTPLSIGTRYKLILKLVQGVINPALSASG